MANWTNIMVDMDAIPEGHVKGIVVDHNGTAIATDLSHPYTVPFNNSMYVELPLTGFGYKVYILRSNSSSYEYYDDVTGGGIEIGILHENDIRKLILKSDKNITGYVQVY